MTARRAQPTELISTPIPDLFTSAAEAPDKDAAALSEALAPPAGCSGVEEQAGSDLFDVVWPHIEQVLATPQSDHAVAGCVEHPAGASAGMAASRA
jgi:hypothetical protein